MKLATLKAGGRDGSLVVVDQGLKTAVHVKEIAETLQYALENWDVCEPALNDVYSRLNAGEMAGAFPFDPAEAHSPLPRSFQWCEASVWISHLERCRKATNRELPPGLYQEPGMYQGASDSFVPPGSPMVCPDENWQPDLEAGVCVITSDVPMGTRSHDAAKYIKLVVLVNDFSLRRLQPDEMAKGLGVLQCKPANAYSPVAVTPRALGKYWDGKLLNRRVHVHVRGELLGKPHAGRDALFNFPQLLEHLARTRNLEAGTIIGAGTVSNYDLEAGFGCLLEKRAQEIFDNGKAETPFLRYGDSIRIECFDDDGASIFGAIEQVLASSDEG